MAACGGSPAPTATPTSVAEIPLIAVDGSCSPSMSNVKVINYTVTTDGIAAESSALVAAIQDSAANETTIQLNDTGDYGVSIRLIASGDLSAGTTFSDDPAVSAPEGQLRALEISGLGPDGSETGAYQGTVIITAASETAISGEMALTYTAPEAAASTITVTFTDVALQTC